MVPTWRSIRRVFCFRSKLDAQKGVVPYNIQTTHKA